MVAHVALVLLSCSFFHGAVSQELVGGGAPAGLEAALTKLTVEDSSKIAVLQSTQTVVNLISIASGILTYKPNGTVLDGKDFSDFLTAGHKNAAITGVQLQSGSYRVLPNSDDAHIFLVCSGRTAPFTIDISGSALSFTDASIGGIAFETCNSVTLTGPANMTYIQEQWPFAQGTIVNISADNLDYTIKIKADFLPAWQRIITQYSSEYAGGGVVYENGLVLPPYRDGTNFVVDFKTVQQQSFDTYFMHLIQDPGLVYINNTVAITQPTVNTGVAMYNSINMLLKDFTIFVAAGFGFYDGTPKGKNTLLRVNLTPMPQAVMSAIHDGYHTTMGKAGPTISYCRFVGAGDDAIAIHGRMVTVAAAQQSQTMMTLASDIGIGTDTLDKGDKINVYSPIGKPLGTATVSTITPTTSPVPPTTEDVVFGGTWESYNYYYKVKLTSWPSGFVGMPFNSFVTVPSRNSNNYRVEYNYISNCRGRGMVIRSSNGVINGNHIVRNSYHGIELAPTFNGREGAFVRDTVVSNNVIDNEAQGITLWSATNTDHPIFYPVNGNVQIVNNSITGPQFGALFITSANTITVANNRFLNIMCSAYDGNTRQANWEIPNTPVQVFNVNGITFRNNSFATDSGCARSVANYAAPLYLVNVTNAVGVAAASGGATATFQAAAGQAAAADDASAPPPLQQGVAEYADVSAVKFPAEQQAGDVLSFQDSAGTLT